MSEWRLVSVDPLLGVQRYELDIDENTTVVRTETYAVNDFFENNKALRDNTEGQPFGHMRLVSSMPLHAYFESDLYKATRQGDNAGIRNFLNDYENQAYRTFKGKV